MRLIIKLCLLLLIAGLTLPLWLKRPDGLPVMTVDDWLEVPPAVESGIDTVRSGLNDAINYSKSPITRLGSDERSATPKTSQGQFYRWQDDSGVWHFSDEAPDGSEQQPKAEYFPEIQNSFGDFKPSAESTGAQPSADPSLPGMLPGLPEGVSKEALEKTLQDAHERRMGDQL